MCIRDRLEGEAAAAEAEAKALAEQIAARRDAFSRAQERQASLQKAVDIYAESAREAAAAAEAEKRIAAMEQAGEEISSRDVYKRQAPGCWTFSKARASG